MGSVERDPGRGLALAASSDWSAADLPAALQGGAKRAIFRGLYKGAEAAALRPRSARASARDGEGSVDTHAGSRDAEVARLGPCAGLRPLALVLGGAPVARSLRPSEGGRGSRVAALARTRLVGRCKSRTRG